MRNRRRNWIFRRIVLGLAVVAVAAPAASAKIPAGESGSSEQPVANTANYMPRATPADWVAYKTNAIELVRAKPSTEGTRSYDPIELVRTGSYDVVNPRSYDAIELVRQQPRTVGTPEVVSAPGFDWGDAGIGAGLAFGLSLLAGGVFLATRRTGRPQTA